MKNKRWAIALLSTAVLAVAFMTTGPTPAASASAGAAAEATYKAKCVACHGAKAEKKFNPAKPDADLLNVMLKGKKPMPAYETSLGAEDCKALVALMKQLRK
jgi:mono/diheme cytochrome c family protein